ncbi:MAG: transcriptional repressor [Clostridia bacterium]|nr:transcriptional repressor [Clostridia bacterium]
MQRNTVQKRLVIDTLRSMANHPSAEMVYEAVHKENPTISKATVYRILKEEASCGELLGIDVMNDVNRYDHRLDPHWHIRCRKCGKVGDVEMLGGVGVNDYAYPDVWTPERISVSFEGLCPECSKEK